MPCMPWSRRLREPSESVATLRDLAVVIVTWQSAAEIAPLLASLAGTLAAGIELAVVENASGDETPALVRRAAPGATVIVNPTNRGFAAAANQGWQATDRPYVLFLNPDTLVDDAGLARGVRHLAADATIGILGCRTTDADGTPQPTVDRFHGVSHLVVATVRAGGMRATVRATSPAVTCDVDWLYGSFLLCRRTVLETVGGFDESYDMYGEDLDLCDRVHAAGWRVVYFADGTIVHHGNRSGARRYGAARDVVALKGTLRWFRRRRGVWHERAFRVAAGAAFAARALAARVAATGGDPDADARARRYAQMARLCATGDPAARRERPTGWRRMARQGLS